MTNACAGKRKRARASARDGVWGERRDPQGITTTFSAGMPAWSRLECVACETVVTT